MKQRFCLCRRRNGVYFMLDTQTGQRRSLRTKNRREALRLQDAQNQTFEQPMLNLALARLSGFRHG